MNILSKFTGKGFKQSDNKGKLQNTVEQATDYWMLRNRLKKFEPFLLYEFEDGTDAVRALMNLDCIKIAEDSGELICLEHLTFGYYPLESGKYEVILSGKVLGIKLFERAEKSFELNNGKKINSKKPQPSESPFHVLKISAHKRPGKITTEEKKAPNTQKAPEVEFIKEETAVKRGSNYTFRIYKAKSDSDAVRFLQTKIVVDRSTVLVVKTPKGSYGRNYSGIFKSERKQNA